MEKKTPSPRTPKGRYPKGTSGNPSGRPPGSRNKSTLLLLAPLEQAADSLVQRAIAMALDGSVPALRLCIERLFPPCKDRTVQIDLPQTKTARDRSAALSAVIDAIADGQLTPAEGESMANILATDKELATAGDVEYRLERLEEHNFGHHQSEPEPGDIAQQLRPGHNAEGHALELQNEKQQAL